MTYVMRLVAGPGIGEGETEVWLSEYDPDAHAPGRPFPTGEVGGTGDPAAAMKFETPSEAWELWRQPSSAVPTRPDGKPNRPLSAFTIAVEPPPVEGR